MAITIDYSTFTINVPKNDMLLVQSSPVEVRELDIDTFRTTLNDLMDDSDGMPFPTNHEHTPPKTISGVTLARVVEILEPYTITFENLAYNVNVTGGNSNISDRVNKNQVGVNTANSAGLQDSGFGQVIEGTITRDDLLRILLAVAAGKSDSTNPVAFRDVADSKDRVNITMTGSNRTTINTLDGT